jgi:hypothetical protein
MAGAGAAAWTIDGEIGAPHFLQDSASAQPTKPHSGHFELFMS